MEKSVSAYGWILRVDLAGGRIVELIHDGNLIFGTFDRIDGKKGSTHLCVPNFGAEGQKQFGLPFHGPARLKVWEVLQNGQRSDTLSVATTLPSTASYPSSLRVIQKFILKKECFRHEVTVKNIGGISVAVNIGIHNYWAAPAGWEGAKLNGEDITTKVKENGYSKLRDINRIVLPGKISYRWISKGFADAVLWSGRKDGTYDKKYICIEPVVRYDSHFFGCSESLLNKEKSINTCQEIYPV